MGLKETILICPACGCDQLVLSANWRIMSQVKTNFVAHHNIVKGCDITEWSVLICQE